MYQAPIITPDLGLAYLSQTYRTLPISKKFSRKFSIILRKVNMDRLRKPPNTTKSHLAKVKVNF